MTEVEDFGTGLDLRQVSPQEAVPIPPKLRLVEESNTAGVRGIYVEDRETGEGARLIVLPNGHKDLGIGQVFNLSGAPKLNTLTPSGFVTAKGITLGASAGEVTEAYGKAPRKSYPQWPDLEFVQYEHKIPGGLVTILAFTFKEGVVVAMDSILYSPSEQKAWQREVHNLDELGQELKRESKVRDTNTPPER